MLYINLKSRAKLNVFRNVLYSHMKEHRLRYTDQRERVLKVLYEQSYPVDIKSLVAKLNEQTLGASYATVIRNVKLFEKLGLLIVTNKVHKEYLLKKEIRTEE